MTSQLNYIARKRQAERVPRAEQTRLASDARVAGSASAPRRDPTPAGGRSPSFAPETPPECIRTPVTRAGGVDATELDDQVQEMYDRGLTTEEPRAATPHAGPLAEASGYPPLCAHGMNSLTDRGYDLALARLHRG